MDIAGNVPVIQEVHIQSKGDLSGSSEYLSYGLLFPWIPEAAAFS